MQPSADRQAGGAEGGDQHLRGAQAADRIAGHVPGRVNAGSPHHRAEAVPAEALGHLPAFPWPAGRAGPCPPSNPREPRAWSPELGPGTPGTLREKQNLEKEALRAGRGGPRELGLQEFWAQSRASPPA